MASDAVLAIIFIITLVLAGVVRNGMKKPIAAKYVLGIAALILAAVAYLLNNNTVPSWLLVLAGILILLDARFTKKHAR